MLQAVYMLLGLPLPLLVVLPRPTTGIGEKAHSPSSSQDRHHQQCSSALSTCQIVPAWLSQENLVLLMRKYRTQKTYWTEQDRRRMMPSATIQDEESFLD